MNASVGIIGIGSVGASVAISALHAGVANELLLSDVRADVAEGEAMDLAHGASFYPAAQVRAASVEEMIDTDAVVIAAGRGGKPGESRLELLRDNVKTARELAAQLRGYRGLVVVVTNPVDVLTYVVAEASGLPTERVIGTGTMLDTARLRQTLGEELELDPRSVHAQVVGEHGDSEVVLWSSAQARVAARAGARGCRPRSDRSIRDHQAQRGNEPCDRARDRGTPTVDAPRRATCLDGVACAGREHHRPERRGAVTPDDRRH